MDPEIIRDPMGIHASRTGLGSRLRSRTVETKGGAAAFLTAQLEGAIVPIHGLLDEYEAQAGTLGSQLTQGRLCQQR